MSVTAGDIITICERNENGWALGRNATGLSSGWVPLGYTKKMKRKKETNSGTSFTPERTGSEEGKMDVDDENYIIVEQSPTLIPNVATFEDFKIDLNQSSPRNQDSLQQEQHDEDEKKRRIS